MELGKHLAQIVDYGMQPTKAGNEQVWIKFQCGNEDDTWYGSPWKRDGEANDLCIKQLAMCGFNSETDDIISLAKGVESGLLIQGEDIEIVVADEVTGDGSLRRRIKSIGEIGPNRLTAEEARERISDEKISKLKSIANKFVVRKRKNPNEVVPF